jgi:hypothetical protein
MDQSKKGLFFFWLAGGLCCIFLFQKRCKQRIGDIQNQEAHHKKERFLDEYKRMMMACDIEYDDHYIFKEPA